MALHKSMKLAFAWIWIAFIVLIFATAVTIRYANENYTGPIERDYYEIGLNYENPYWNKNDRRRIRNNFV